MCVNVCHKQLLKCSDINGVKSILLRLSAPFDARFSSLQNEIHDPKAINVTPFTHIAHAMPKFIHNTSVRLQKMGQIRYGNTNGERKTCRASNREWAQKLA